MSKCKNFRNYFADQIVGLSEFLGVDPNKQEDLDAPCHSLIRETQARQEKLQALYAELDEYGLGMIVANESGDSFALISPDVSEPGRFRYSGFRAIGWMTHYTVDTLDEVVLEAFKAGYTCVAARDTLEKMSATTEWKKGSERLVHMQAHQNGRLTWNEMLAEFEKIEIKYAQQQLAA
ncbi:hypothetical protein [Pseudomonas baetica]|uniref:hypothetical protein n=1 Tax=Pseudomonas baetica TaxID=674054 RepID=UPI002404D782|nr:hypothetical protein [Pseudomonas baetica]MDF9779118.1 hypothetical protein [Pseudomonas baetica]